MFNPISLPKKLTSIITTQLEFFSSTMYFHINIYLLNPNKRFIFLEVKCFSQLFLKKIYFHWLRMSYYLIPRVYIITICVVLFFYYWVSLFWHPPPLEELFLNFSSYKFPSFICINWYVCKFAYIVSMIFLFKLSVIF